MTTRPHVIAILICVSASVLPLAYTGTLAEPTPITDPPAIPGTKIVASLGKLCPRDAPVKADWNNDGTEDLLWPSYHQGNLKSYASYFAIKAFTGNKNFTYAGAINGKDHTPLWSFQAGAMIDKHAIAPTRRHLYVGSHDNHVYAFDLTSGKRIWAHDTEGNILGLAASAKEVIAVTARNKIAAFTPADGSVMWEKKVKTAVMAHPDFGIMLQDDETIYLSSLDNHVYALDRRSGRQRWDYTSGGNPSLRLLTEGLLLVADKKQLVAIDITSGKTRWRYDTGAWVHGEPIIDLGGTVALFNGQRGKKAKFLAIDLASGKLRWSVNLEKIPVSKKWKVFVPQDSSAYQTIFRVTRDQAGQVQVFYIADRKKVWAIQASDGKTLWTVAVPATQLIYPSRDRLVLASGKKTIHAVDLQDGKEQWKRKTDAHIFQVQRLGDALFALYSKDLMVLDFSTGDVKAAFHLGEPFRLVPIEEDRLILCAEAGSWILAPAAR